MSIETAESSLDANAVTRAGHDKLEFVSGNKAHLASLPQIRLHIQKCDTCRDEEKPNCTIRVFTMIQYPYTAVGKNWLLCKSGQPDRLNLSRGSKIRV